MDERTQSTRPAYDAELDATATRPESHARDRRPDLIPPDLPIVSARKADLGKRAVAAIIDGVIGAVISMIPLIGGLIAAAYWLLRDGLEFEFMDRRSIGKKLMKLRPVTLDGSPVDAMTSIKRNWMFAFGGLIAVLGWIPIIGWLLMIPIVLIAVGIGIVELVLVLTDAQGRRLGDKLAATQVVEVDS